MTHTPHELAADFPDKVDDIHRLKTTNGEFRHLAERYHEVNRALHRAETLVEPVEHFREEEMRKERMHLKDRIARMLNGAA